MQAYYVSLFIIAVLALTAAVSFNRDTTDIFTSASRREITNIMNDFLSYPNELMWKQVNDLNDRNHPLIFFHQRKAGGTSIRDILYQVSKRNQLSHYVVCYSDTKNCDVFELPVKQLYSVYGGHFQWNSLRNLNRFRPTNGSDFNFSCITNFREPVSFKTVVEILSSVLIDNLSCFLGIEAEELLTLSVPRRYPADKQQ